MHFFSTSGNSEKKNLLNVSRNKLGNLNRPDSERTLRCEKNQPLRSFDIKEPDSSLAVARSFHVCRDRDRVLKIRRKIFDSGSSRTKSGSRKFSILGSKLSKNHVFRVPKHVENPGIRKSGRPRETPWDRKRVISRGQAHRSFGARQENHLMKLFISQAATATRDDHSLYDLQYLVI